MSVTGRGPRLLSQPLFWLALVTLLAAIPIARAVLTPKAKPLERLGAAPTFTLTDQNGQAFGTDQLRGKVWAANFIFTRCPTICPTFTAKMVGIEARSEDLGEAFHLVSFSVDPEWDTPSRLKEYGEKYRANARRWSFLTGPMAAVKAVVVDGMRQPLQRGADDDLTSYVHGGYFVLVDQTGQIRGYYGLSDSGTSDAVLRDAAALIAGRAD